MVAEFVILGYMGFIGMDLNSLERNFAMRRRQCRRYLLAIFNFDMDWCDTTKGVA